LIQHLEGVILANQYFKNNYPLGLQLIGKAFEEQNLLNISYSMEKELSFKNNFQDWWIK